MNSGDKVALGHFHLRAALVDGSGGRAVGITSTLVAFLFELTLCLNAFFFCLLLGGNHFGSGNRVSMAVDDSGNVCVVDNLVAVHFFRNLGHFVFKHTMGVLVESLEVLVRQFVRHFAEVGYHRPDVSGKFACAFLYMVHSHHRAKLKNLGIDTHIQLSAELLLESGEIVGILLIGHKAVAARIDRLSSLPVCTFLITFAFDLGSVRCSLDLIVGSYSTRASVCCRFIVCRQNPVFVGYFFAVMSEVFSNCHKFISDTKHNFVAILEILFAICNNITYSLGSLIRGSKTLALPNMFVEDMRESATLVSPYQVNIAEPFPAEYANQIAFFIAKKKIYSLLHLTLELSIDFPKYSRPRTF